MADKAKQKDVNYYKSVLQVALGEVGKLSIKTKEEVIAFKNKLAEYMRLVNMYNTEKTESSSSDGQYEDLESTVVQLNAAKEDLDSLEADILREVAMIKSTFK